LKIGLTPDQRLSKSTSSETWITRRLQIGDVFHMRKALVTGGAGFAGRHLVKALLDAGYEVHAVDSLAPYTGAKDPAAGWPLFDPRDYSNFNFAHEDCRSWFARVRDTDFDYAFHLAALVGGRLMIEKEPLSVAQDLSIDAAFWQWAKAVRPKKCVYLSSSAAYPIKHQRPDHFELLTEDMISFDSDIGMPDLTYGWAKLTGEYLALLAYERHGIESAVYRPFSGYGEDQDDAYPFPSICKRAIECRNDPSMTVWGSGRQMRDFIHIDDCVAGILATMDAMKDGKGLNLSTGIFTSFIDFAKIAADALGVSLDVRGTSDMPEGVFARGGDTKLQQQLGFSAKTPFDVGVHNALHFFLEKDLACAFKMLSSSTTPRPSLLPGAALKAS
jgi:GDP-L-fucose synthase